MFKFVFCATNRHQKSLTSPFSLTIALLCYSKKASSEPFASCFRRQNQNLNKLLGATSQTMKKPCLLVLLSLMALGFQGCYSVPEFDLTPSITFRNVEQYTKKPNQFRLYDSLVLVVKFQDGDGNLGLSTTNPEDIMGEFAFGQPAYYNFNAVPFKKVNGTFQPIFLNGKRIEYPSRFPRIFSDTRVEPLEGDIRFSLIIDRNNLIKVNDTLRFEIMIKDRAKNNSNLVTTSEIIMFSK